MLAVVSSLIFTYLISFRHVSQTNDSSYVREFENNTRTSRSGYV